MNVRVGRIARRQASMGSFVPEATPPPSPVAFASEDEDDDDGDDDDASDDDDGDASLLMRCLLDTLTLVTHDKKGE